MRSGRGFAGLSVLTLWTVMATSGFAQQAPVDHVERWPPVATFSILGYDPETGEVGGAVQSRVFSVGNLSLIHI